MPRIASSQLFSGLIVGLEGMVVQEAQMEVRRAEPVQKDLSPPACPACLSVMSIRCLDPIVCTSGLQEITYRCVVCNIEVRRMIRRGT
jgi:hypothetical protein